MDNPVVAHGGRDHISLVVRNPVLGVAKIETNNKG